MTEDNVLEWEDLSKEDQDRAEKLLKELNNLFKKYKEDPKEKDKSLE